VAEDMRHSNTDRPCLPLLPGTQQITVTTGSCCIILSAVSIKAVAIEFEHLYKIRSAVGNCEGFDLTALDRLIEVLLQSLQCQRIDQMLGKSHRNVREEILSGKTVYFLCQA